MRFSKNIMFIGLACTAALYSCKDQLDIPDQPIDSYTQVFMPEGVNGPVAKVLKIKDSVQTAIYGAGYGGQGYPDQDIPLTFMVDKEKVDGFNVANKTAYALLPDGSYTLSGLNATIPKGGVSTVPLSISFKTTGEGAMEALKTYVLPISIASTSIKVNEALRTTFYVVTAQPDFNDYTNYDRTAWTVKDFSSEQAEGSNNGRAIFAIDGYTDTYWHTQYKGSTPTPPHVLTIDMGSEKILHGLSFVGRQNTGAGKPNEVNVQLSLDNMNWTDGGTFNLENIKDLQKKFILGGFRSARYFKVTINTVYGGTFTQIAELNAF